MAQGDGLCQVHGHWTLSIRPKSLYPDFFSGGSRVLGSPYGLLERCHSHTVAERATANRLTLEAKFSACIR
jgi:hypothetical protein